MYFKNRLTFLFFSLTTVFIIISFLDLIYDLSSEGYQLLEVLEFVLILAMSTSLTLLWMQLWKNYKYEQSTVLLMKSSQKRFRSKHDASLHSMKQAIDEQFTDWKLTATEKIIARYLILGYPFQKISEATSTSPKTIQNHATSIYTKSMTLGRSDLAAFFLHDIFEE